MNYRSTYRRTTLPLWLLVLLATPPGLFAHGGEDHGEAVPAAVSTPGTAENQLITDGTTDLFELLLKYPAPETGEEARLRLFLADYATNQPIENAEFTLSFRPSGVALRQQPRMLSPGIYEMVAEFPDDTVYSMVATVTAGQRTDFLEVRNIYAGEAAERFLAEHAPGATLQSDNDTGMSWWMILLIALAAGAVGWYGVRVIARRSRHRETASASVARDPELAQQGGAEGDSEAHAVRDRDDDEPSTGTSGRMSNA